MSAMWSTGGEIGMNTPDNLIDRLYYPPHAFTAQVEINQGVLPRGMVLGLDDEKGIYAPMKEGLKASCILADEIDTGAVPAEQPAQAAELVSQFAEEYARAGITVEGGKIVYKPTGDVDEKITHVIGGTRYIFVGLSFTKPAEAEIKAVKIRMDGEVLRGTDGATVISLEKDGEDVVNGNPVVYFAVAEAAGEELSFKAFNMEFEWKKESGETVKKTAFTAARFDGDTMTATAYRSGHFYRAALIVSDGYELSGDDENNLRLAGIFLSDGI